MYSRPPACSFKPTTALPDWTVQHLPPPTPIRWPTMQAPRKILRKRLTCLARRSVGRTAGQLLSLAGVSAHTAGSPATLTSLQTSTGLDQWHASQSAPLTQAL